MAFLEAHLPQDYSLSEQPNVNHTTVISDESFLNAPRLVAPFIYDAVVALGLAACDLALSPKDNVYFTGEELYNTFLNTTFAGASGSIVIDQSTGTRDPQSALFSLTNIVEDDEASVSGANVQFKEVTSDLFNSGTWESRNPYIFYDGTSDIPSDIPALETNTNYLSTGLKAFGSFMCAVILVLALGFSIWTNYNSKRRVVRASQPIFLNIITAGAALMALSIIPLTLDLGVTDQEGADAACISFPWLLTIGFSLTFSALFTKTYRINTIMKSAAKFKRLKLTARDVMKPMIVLLALNVIVLTVWTAVDPLQRKTKVVTEDPFGRPLETYGVCSSDYGYIFLIIICIINLGSLLYAVIQAYQVRKLDTELHESSSIFQAMSLVLLLSFLGVPVTIIARDNTQVYYFVLSGIIFIMCSLILLLIFVPKVMAVRKGNNNSSGSKNSPVTGADRSYNRQATTQSSIDDDYSMIVNAEIDELKEENRELKRLLTVKDPAALNNQAAEEDGTSYEKGQSGNNSAN
ncbi:hypothetical protein ACHAXR_007962 [Thalassiosira sp. AJA248-18]